MWDSLCGDINGARRGVYRRNFRLCNLKFLLLRLYTIAVPRVRVHRCTYACKFYSHAEECRFPSRQISSSTSRDRRVVAPCIFPRDFSNLGTRDGFERDEKFRPVKISVPKNGESDSLAFVLVRLLRSSVASVLGFFGRVLSYLDIIIRQSRHRETRINSIILVIFSPKVVKVRKWDVS